MSFRVSVLPIFFGEKIVMRLLRENRSGYTLEGLGFHGQALERMHDSMKQTTGIILVTGPTGSGKTTTLYTILDLLNTPEVNISTIEDPIEYIYEQKKSVIDQREVRTDTHDFASALRSVFRQDVDVILVGEMRGNETMATAVTAAETGHLVLSTLHTNNAAQTINPIS